MFYGNLKIRVKKRIKLFSVKTASLALCITTLLFCAPKVFVYAMAGSEDVEVPEVTIIVEPEEAEVIIAVSTMQEERMPERVEETDEFLSEDAATVAEVSESEPMEEVAEVSDNTSDENDVSAVDSEAEVIEETVSTEEPIVEEEIEVTSEEEETWSPTMRYCADEEEYALLCSVVEAEVEGYDVWISKGLDHEEIIQAKARVAQVFLNRVEDTEDFTSIVTLEDALTQENATSTIKNGRAASVTITEYTIEAVDRALNYSTEDYTQGALFFSSGQGGQYGTYLFTDEVGHKFSK